MLSLHNWKKNVTKWDLYLKTIKFNHFQEKIKLLLNSFFSIRTYNKNGFLQKKINVDIYREDIFFYNSVERIARELFGSFCTLLGATTARHTHPHCNPFADTLPNTVQQVPHRRFAPNWLKLNLFSEFTVKVEVLCIMHIFPLCAA